MAETNGKSNGRRGIFGQAIGAADSLRRTLLGLSTVRLDRSEPGTAAGIEVHDLDKMLQTAPKNAQQVQVTCIDYSPEQAVFQKVDDLEDFIIQHRPEWASVRWINVDGLTDLDVIKAFAEKYDLHPLAIEDVLHIPQRPKVETYPAHGEVHGRIFLITRMLQFEDDGTTHGHLNGEQISFFLGRKTLITFQETPGDIWDPIRNRIKTKGSRLRENDASFLMYSLLDAIVDHCFPILEHYSDRLEELEDAVLVKPDKTVIQQIHAVKRELLLLRRAVWPMREVVNAMMREQHECLSDNTRTYLRDVYDHTVQIIDMVETYREFAASMTETYMSSLSNKMNEVMKVLTIITTIFVPLTFLAGVYGMNFKHFPELEMPHAYPLFWTICISVAVGMIVWFKRRNWL